MVANLNNYLYGGGVVFFVVYIRLINKLQIVKRLRPLNIDEVKELFGIIESPTTSEDVLVCAYLLLDQKPIAELHFNNLDKDRQEEFKQFPIYHFGEKE